MHKLAMTTAQLIYGRSYLVRPAVSEPEQVYGCVRRAFGGTAGEYSGNCIPKYWPTQVV